jgi:hypothetical protein
VFDEVTPKSPGVVEMLRDADVFALPTRLLTPTP